MDPQEMGKIPEVAMEEVEVLPEGEEESREPEEAGMKGYSAEEPEEGKEVEEACMSVKSETKKEASFADRLRQAMDLPHEEAPASMDAPGGDIPDVPMGEVEVVEMSPEGAMPGEMPGEEGCGCPGAEEEAILKVEEGDVTIPDEPAPAPMAPEEEYPVQAAVEEDEAPATEQVYETLAIDANLSDVTRDRVDLVLTQEKTANPHYVVLVDGDPVAKIALSDQPENMIRDHADLFMDEDYPTFVLEHVAQFGFSDTMDNVHAKRYRAAAARGEVAAQMKQAAAEEMAEDQHAAIAQAKDRLINTANIALQGSTKNYILENPLKDRLVGLMRGAGVDENAAVDIVEDAWQEAAPAYFENILAKAEEWMNAPTEVLDHHIREISAMTYRHPGYTAPVREEIPMAAPRPAPVEAAPQNVPLRTHASAVPQAPAGDWQAEKARWKRSLNLHGRVASASMANYDNGNKR
jgi:hypothetical protein